MHVIGNATCFSKNRFKGATCATTLPGEVQQQEGETGSKYNAVSQSGRYGVLPQ